MLKLIPKILIFFIIKDFISRQLGLHNNKFALMLGAYAALYAA